LNVLTDLLFCFQELRCKLAYVEQCSVRATNQKEAEAYSDRRRKNQHRSAHLAVFALHPIYCLGITNKRDNILSLE
jgi:membrane protein required for beta-lactamase induction